jgi:SAM-dependent methyltransferase
MANDDAPNIQANEFVVCVCPICGHKGPVQRGEQQAVRDGFACAGCTYNLKYKDVAACVVDEFGRGRALSLSQLISHKCLDEVAILEVTLGSPFRRYFRNLSGYLQVFGRPGGEEDTASEGVLYENLSALSFPKDSFDLVITMDLLDTLFDAGRAFSEISRVLKRGGLHVFTVGIPWPPPEKTKVRADLINGQIKHFEPERVRRGRGGQSLVVTDFGTDAIENLRQYGFLTRIVRRSLPLDGAYQNATFVSRKMA